MRVVQRLWQDDAGFIVSAELILIATILVIGIVVGINAIRNSITNELADVAQAVDTLNQGYVVQGLSGHAAGVSGWAFGDEQDFCDTNTPSLDDVNMCILQSVPYAANDETAPPQLNP